METVEKPVLGEYVAIRAEENGVTIIGLTEERIQNFIILKTGSG